MTIICNRTVSATKIINLFVVDANDNPPIFAPPKQYSVSIPEEMAIGSSVLTVQATDADFGAGAQLTFSVLSGQDSAFFYADSIIIAGSGVVKINQVLLCSVNFICLNLRQ